VLRLTEHVVVDWTVNYRLVGFIFVVQVLAFGIPLVCRVINTKVPLGTGLRRVSEGKI